MSSSCVKSGKRHGPYCLHDVLYDVGGVPTHTAIPPRNDNCIRLKPLLDCTLDICIKAHRTVQSAHSVTAVLLLLPNTQVATAILPGSTHQQQFVMWSDINGYTHIQCGRRRAGAGIKHHSSYYEPINPTSPSQVNPGCLGPADGH